MQYQYISFIILILFNLIFLLLGLSLCPEPNIVNGNYSITRNFYQRKVNSSKNEIMFLILASFQCKSNYTLNGMPQIRCIKGKWVHSFPICQENILECITPKVSKGWVECLTVGCNRFYVGTEAAIRCERGYRLLGNSRMHCQMQNEKRPSWSSPVPKCVLIESEYEEPESDRQSFSLLYTENNSIMIIIIILSVLAGGLMLLLSIMLINRLFQRRRLMRIQRSENSFNQPPVAEITNIDPERNIIGFPVVARESSAEPPSSVRWNCFSTLTCRNLRYQHMDTQTTEPVNNFDQENNPIDNFEIYNNNIYSDDRTSLIQPPCYEEAIKCSQYSIVAPKNSIDHQKLKGNQYKPKSKLSTRSNGKESRSTSHRHFNSKSLPDDTHGNINQSITSISNTSMQSNFNGFPNTDNNKNCSQNNVDSRSNDMDNFSRRSAPDHRHRVANNVTESNASCQSGSIETMTISDGTSVTVHTLDSRGSNPSLGSMRPQTGSIGDQTNSVNNCSAQCRYPSGQEQSNVILTEADATVSESRYSPPPSYECSLNNPMVIKALFVDNMACTEQVNENLS